MRLKILENKDKCSESLRRKIKAIKASFNQFNWKTKSETWNIRLASCNRFRLPLNKTRLLITSLMYCKSVITWDRIILSLFDRSSWFKITRKFLKTFHLIRNMTEPPFLENWTKYSLKSMLWRINRANVLLFNQVRTLTLHYVSSRIVLLLIA